MGPFLARAALHHLGKNGPQQAIGIILNRIELILSACQDNGWDDSCPNTRVSLALARETQRLPGSLVNSILDNRLWSFAARETLTIFTRCRLISMETTGVADPHRHGFSRYARHLTQGSGLESLASVNEDVQRNIRLAGTYPSSPR